MDARDDGEMSDAELFYFAVHTLNFKFRRMRNGELEMQWPFMPAPEELLLIRETEQEMTRRGSTFKGFVELQMIGEEQGQVFVPDLFKANIADLI